MTLEGKSLQTIDDIMTKLKYLKLIKVESTHMHEQTQFNQIEQGKPCPAADKREKMVYRIRQGRSFQLPRCYYTTTNEFYLCKHVMISGDEEKDRIRVIESHKSW